MSKENGLSTTAISIILAIVIVIAFFAFFVFRSGSGTGRVSFGTVSEALATGKDIKCTYEGNGDTATYFFGQGMVRAEAESAGAKTYLILRPEAAIVWTAAQPPLTANTEETAVFRDRLLSSSLREYDCREVTFDYSVFTPPAQ